MNVNARISRLVRLLKQEFGWLQIYAYFCKYIMDDVVPFMLKALFVYWLIKKL